MLRTRVAEVATQAARRARRPRRSEVGGRWRGITTLVKVVNISITISVEGADERICMTLVLKLHQRTICRNVVDIEEYEFDFLGCCSLCEFWRRTCVCDLNQRIHEFNLFDLRIDSQYLLGVKLDDSDVNKERRNPPRCPVMFLVYLVVKLHLSSACKTKKKNFYTPTPSS